MLSYSTQYRNILLTTVNDVSFRKTPHPQKRWFTETLSDTLKRMRMNFKDILKIYLVKAFQSYVSPISPNIPLASLGVAGSILSSQ